MDRMDCPYCQHRLSSQSRFCEWCGKPIVTDTVSVQNAISMDQVDISALTRLRKEKHQLAHQLNTLLEGALGRVLTAEERHSWEVLYTHWKTITDELTARMNLLERRQETDRRQAERRQQERRKQYQALDLRDRRAATDRRMHDRRSGQDRRDPFADPDSGPGSTHTPIPDGG
jgi:hypothetical protein